MKKNLFLRLCLIMIALLSLSCRQDILAEQETYNNSGAFQLTSKKISLNEAKHKAILLPEIEQMETKLKAKAKSSSFGKTVNYGNGVSIDTDNVIYIENGPNFHTYTFTIKRNNAPETTPLENLLLVPETDGSYKEFLVTYNLTPQEREKIRNGEPVDTKNKTTITELAKGSFNIGGQLAKMSCNWHEETIWQGCSHIVNGVSMHNQSNVSEWPNCKADVPPSVYTIIVGGCTTELPETIDYPGGPGSGTGSGGGGDGTDPGTLPECTTVANNPGEVGITNPNGCNTGAPTQPNVPIRNNNPCAKMKAQNENTDFKDKVSLLDKAEVFTKKIETGYAAAYGPQTAYQQMQNSPNGNVKLPDGNKYFGYLHSHLNKEGVVKIFSPYDVSTFLSSCVRNAELKGSMTDAYAMVITSQGNYMLKYSGDGSYGIGQNQLNNWSSWYAKEYSNLLENDKFTQPNIEKVFTQFLKETVNINGLELYKIDKITGNATKLEYDGKDNPVKTTPCPLT